jgi:hypothetical protein
MVGCVTAAAAAAVVDVVVMSVPGVAFDVTSTPAAGTPMAAAMIIARSFALM